LTLQNARWTLHLPASCAHEFARRLNPRGNQVTEFWPIFTEDHPKCPDIAGFRGTPDNWPTNCI
jgi:hypothetical protein